MSIVHFSYHTLSNALYLSTALFYRGPNIGRVEWGTYACSRGSPGDFGSCIEKEALVMDPISPSTT